MASPQPPWTSGQWVGALAVLWAVVASAIVSASDSWGLTDGAGKVNLLVLPVLTGLLGLRWVTSR